jgi:dephospho-CoA kinase
MIVAVSGKKRSGKDTFYQLVKEYVEHGTNIRVVRFAFADAVKKYAESYFAVSRYTDKEEYRFILQGIGQMMREEVRKSYWIDITSRGIEEEFTKYGKDNVIAIITDVRYLNEMEWALENADISLRIERAEAPSDDSHPSEVELDKFDFGHKIINNGDMCQYREVVSKWVSEHLLR